jgi:hypothetical protein
MSLQKTKMVPTSSLKKNPENPRVIRDEKFKKLVKSLEQFPEMLMARPIVVNEDMVIIGGNQRYSAAIVAGLTEVPVFVATWSIERQKEFVIKDNASAGEWDWETLANSWENDDLKEWGVLPDFAYTPELTPGTQMGDVTEDDIANRQRQIEEGLNAGNSYKQVCCPECGHEFNIA